MTTTADHRTTIVVEECIESPIRPRECADDLMVVKVVVNYRNENH